MEEIENYYVMNGLEKRIFETKIDARVYFERQAKKLAKDNILIRIPELNGFDVIGKNTKLIYDVRIIHGN